MINLITYDLRKPGRDYSSLYEAIKSSGSWAHPLESIWFVDTDKEPGGIRDQLSKQVDANDSVFVVCMERSWGSWNFSKEVNDWLNNPARRW